MSTDHQDITNFKGMVEILCIAKRKDGAFQRNTNCWNVNPNVYLYVCNVIDYTVFSNLM